MPRGTRSYQAEKRPGLYRTGRKENVKRLGAEGKIGQAPKVRSGMKKSSPSLNVIKNWK